MLGGVENECEQVPISTDAVWQTLKSNEVQLQRINSSPSLHSYLTESSNGRLRVPRDCLYVWTQQQHRSDEACCPVRCDSQLDADPLASQDTRPPSSKLVRSL